MKLDDAGEQMKDPKFSATIERCSFSGGNEGVVANGAVGTANVTLTNNTMNTVSGSATLGSYFLYTAGNNSIGSVTGTLTPAPLQ